MKNSYFKYVFFGVILVLVVASIIKINVDKNNPNKNQKANTTAEIIDENKESEINLAIASLDNINPIISKNKYVQDISKLIFEPLVNLSQDYKAEQCLAKEWAKTDNNTYIIKLKENIKWSNGEKFTASDVKFTVDRLKENSSIYSYNVEHVIGLDIVDDYTIKIALDREIPFFEYNLTFPILNEKYYDGEDFYNTEKNNTTIGTGMYKISNIENGKIILERNSNWWNLKDSKLPISKININLYGSIGEVYNAFKIGNVDLLGITNMDYQQYIGTIGYNSKEYAGREHDFLALNTQSEILSQVEVRKAISLSIDRDNIISNIYGNKRVKSSFPLDHGNWLCNGLDTNIDYNPENANQILSENGWEYRNNSWQKVINGKNKKINIKLVVRASDAQKVVVANTITSMLDSRGIRVNVVQASDTQYNNYLSAKNYDMILCSRYLSLSPDLTTYFGNNNLANFYTDELQSIIQEVNNTTDENKLKEDYKKLFDMYKNTIPYISLYSNKNATVYNTSLVGEINPNWFNLFYNINTWYK